MLNSYNSKKNEHTCIIPKLESYSSGGLVSHQIQSTHTSSWRSGPVQGQSFGSHTQTNEARQNYSLEITLPETMNHILNWSFLMNKNWLAMFCKSEYATNICHYGMNQQQNVFAGKTILRKSGFIILITLIKIWWINFAFQSIEW